MIVNKLAMCGVHQELSQMNGNEIPSLIVSISSCVKDLMKTYETSLTTNNEIARGNGSK